MSMFIFKNIELSQWIKPHLTTYILAADDDELETLQDDYDRFENIKFLTWDKTPSSEELSKIQALIIEEPESGEYDISDLPDWINTLGNLKVLAFPYVCFSKLENTIKNSALTLETLYFFIPREWDDEKFEIPASLEMPNLSAFISRSETNGLFGLKANNFPNISYLECNISKYKNIKKLDEIKNFKKLIHASFHHGKSLNILENISSDLLESISLVGFSGQNFSISKLKEFKNLRYIALNGIKKAEVDCELFTHLPSLSYLDLVSCFNLKNVNELANIKSLEYLIVLDCKRPFDNATIDLLKNQNISYIDIDFA